MLLCARAPIIPSLRVVHVGIACTFMVSAGVVRTSVGACALWLTWVLCAPLWWQGWFVLRCARAVVLGSSHPGFVGGSFPFLSNQTF